MESFLFCILVLYCFYGVLAQLGARNIRIVEATGSNPVYSTERTKSELAIEFGFAALSLSTEVIICHNKCFSPLPRGEYQIPWIYPPRRGPWIWLPGQRKT